MLGYISRGFVAIVMKRPGLPWPLKGLPALNDLGAERRGSGAEPGCGPPPAKKLQGEHAIGWFIYTPLVCQRALLFSISFFFFLAFNTHIWLTCFKG